MLLPLSLPIRSMFMATYITIIAFISLTHISDARADAENQVMFVLDGSNSMWGQINGTAKISIAKDVMSNLLKNWNEDIPAGLVIYGHRRKDDCQDIEIVSNPGAVDRQILINKIQSIKPRGKTPISLSLLMAKSQLLLHNLTKYPKPKTSLVLVSDGLETCNSDPCAKALEWEVSDPGTDVHVIGFDLTDEESKALQCIADNTGGKFFRANNANDLQEALKETVEIASGSGGNDSEPTPAPDTKGEPAKPQASQFLYAKLCETCKRLAPLDVSWNVYKDGKPFFEGLGVIYPSDPVLEAGTYEVAVRYHSTHVTAKGEIEFGEDGKQIGEINLNGGSAVMFAYATDDKMIAADPIFYEFFPIKDGKAASKSLAQNASSNSATWLPAGRYKVVATHDRVKESAEIEIIAGQETRYDFDMRVGYFLPSAVLTSGGKPLGTDVDYFVYGSENAANNASPLDSIVSLQDGTKERPLKPGRYFVKAYLGYKGGLTSMTRIFPFEIKANQVTQPVFDMQAGILSHTVKSNGAMKVGYVEYVDMNSGKRVDTHLYGSNELALPQGQYFLRISGDNKETGKYETVNTDPFEIVGGKKTTINVTIP